MALDYQTIIAAGAYNGAAGGAAAAYGERGAVVTRAGAGLYDITLPLDRGVDITEGSVIASVGGAVQAAIRCIHTSDTVKRIATETVGGAAGPVDADFKWMIVRFAP